MNKFLRPLTFALTTAAALSLGACASGDKIEDSPSETPPPMSGQPTPGMPTSEGTMDAPPTQTAPPPTEAPPPQTDPATTSEEEATTPPAADSGTP